MSKSSKPKTEKTVSWKRKSLLKKNWTSWWVTQKPIIKAFNKKVIPFKTSTGTWQTPNANPAAKILSTNLEWIASSETQSNNPTSLFILSTVQDTSLQNKPSKLSNPSRAKLAVLKQNLKGTLSCISRRPTTSTIRSSGARNSSRKKTVILSVCWLRLNPWWLRRAKLEGKRIW